MKYFKKLILSTLLAAALVTGCNTDELKELNINPQALPQIDMNFLFTAVQLGAASGGSAGDNRYIDWRTNIRLAGYAIQQLATTGGDPGDKYTEDVESTSAPFEFLYGDQLKNVAEILKQTGTGGFSEGKNQNMRQATRIMRAFLFHRLTDYYGRIPYFDALKVDQKIFFPEYDKQREIYADLLKELDEATAAFGASDPADGFANADLFYNGDIAKWKKFGYSLMLRIAMRVSNVEKPLADTYVAKAVTGGVFQSNTENVIVPMDIGPSEWTNQNGISRAFFPGDGGQATFLSKTLIDFLKGADPATVADDDPRLMILSGGIGFLLAKGGELTMSKDNNFDTKDTANIAPLGQKGMPNGKTQVTLNQLEGKTVEIDKEYSKLNYKFLQRDEPYMLMNYGEVELLLAEAAQRTIGGLTPGQAKAHYDAGVKASMQMYTAYDATLTVSDAQVADYLADYPYGVAKPALQMIGEQLWVNHFLNWWEAWTEWRRTGFPVLTPSVGPTYPGNVTQGTIQQRLKYPNAEVAGNPNFASTATTPDLYTTKLWFAGGAE
jgi:hypothetical protein